MKRFVAAFCAALLIFAGIGFQAIAARVTPMVVTIKPSGPASVARLEISNPSDGAFPVEIQMFRGEISEMGELSLTAADEDFLVFPTQMVVPAKSQQALRIQYVGAPDLSQSVVYYAAVRQIPVEMTGAESKVQLIVNFNVLVNVVPDGTRPDPHVEVLSTAVRDDVPGVEVRVSNKGNRYLSAGSVSWQISGSGVDGATSELSRTSADMAKAVGVGVVAPGKSRIFFVPTERLLTAQSVRVTLGQ